MAESNIYDDSQFPKRESIPGQPHFVKLVSSAEELAVGDHVLYQITKSVYREVFRSCLVTDIQISASEECHIVYFTNKEEGVVQKCSPFDELQCLYKVEYSVCRYSAEESVKRAEGRINEEHYHSLNNNSHFFVTWCKTGQEHPLTDILRNLEYRNGKIISHEEETNTLMYKTPVQFLHEINPGDHMVLDRVHYLVKSVSSEDGSISAYTINQRNRVEYYEKVPKLQMQPHKIQFKSDSVTVHIKVEGSYSQLVILNCQHIEKIDIDSILLKAEKELKASSKWISSDHFVTAMRCGLEHSVHEQFVLRYDASPIHCMLVTPDLSINTQPGGALKVNEGDHLVLRDFPNALRSVFVQQYLDDTRVCIKPPIDGGEIVDLTTFLEVYRIEYNDSLPPKQVLRQINSPAGQAFLQRENTSDLGAFITWAKTGRADANVVYSEFLKESHLNERQKIFCEEIVSSNDIQAGDHILECLPSKRTHILVAARESANRFNIVHCKGTFIREETRIITPSIDNRVYRISCSDYHHFSTDVIVERAKSYLGQHMYNPWAHVLFIRYAKTGMKLKRTSSDPVSKSRIKSFTQLVPGDFLVAKSHHYIVVSITSSVKCMVVESHQLRKATKVDLSFSELMEYYRIDYEPGTCLSNEEVVKKAESCAGASKLTDIHYLKTNQKRSWHIKNLKSPEELSSSGVLGAPQHIASISSANNLTNGDHIMYKVNKPPFRPVYRSGLVVKIHKNQKVEIITKRAVSGIIKEEIDFDSLTNIHQVIYLSCRYSEAEVIKRANDSLERQDISYDELYNNSHHFVTWCKCDREYPLTTFLRELEVQGGDWQWKKTLKPVLTKVPVATIGDLDVGNHILIDSQHYFIEHIDAEHKRTFTAYTVNKDGKVEKVTKENIHRIISKIFRIDYEPLSCVSDIAQSLSIANEEMHKKPLRKWKRSDQLVTLLKCGTEHVIDERCLMSNEVTLVGSTLVSQDTSVDDGDHLLLRDTQNPQIFHSVLVHSFVNEACVTIIPPISTLDTKSIKQEMINLRHYQEIYRVNYSHSLPLTDVIERALSSEGESILHMTQKNVTGPGPFITWAKTGKMMEVHVHQLTEKQQIASVHPLQYRRIISPHEIRRGDHLVQFHKGYKDHLFVTELNLDHKDPMKVKVIHCFHTSITEEVMNLNPKENIYQIKYQDELPTELALTRARSLLGRHNFSPLARMWFVRWAKTGSDDGIEVDFLRNICRPVTKSKIECFTQLNPGDYLVEGNHHDKSSSNNWGVYAYHHYLVVSIESPAKCTVIECWYTKIRLKELKLHSKQHLEADVASSISYHPSWFYCINYESGICILAEESISKAKELLEEGSIHWNPMLECARRSFIHYLKTGESSDINIDDLPDDRQLLPREEIQSAMELKPGDHIERPLNIPLASKFAQHHMFVVEPVDNEHCKVIHYHTHPTPSELLRMKKGKVVQEVVNIFDKEACFRVCYPERLDPERGVSNLIQLCGEEGKGRLKSITGNAEYNLMVNNCEHLVTIATLGFPLSIQVSNVVYQALRCSRGAIKAIRLSAIHNGCHLTPESSMHGFYHAHSQTLHSAHLHSAHLHSACTGKAGLGVAAKSGVETATKSTTKSAAKAASKSTTKSVAKIGTKAAASGSVLGAIAGIAFAVNVLIETPLCVRNLYKLHRQRSFGMITEEEYKRSRDGAVITSVNAVAGGTAGAVIGQVAIPVPILGAAAGGFIGNVVGQGCGYAEGWLIGKYAHPDPCDITLPEIIKTKFLDISKLDVKFKVVYDSTNEALKI